MKPHGQHSWGDVYRSGVWFDQVWQETMYKLLILKDPTVLWVHSKKLCCQQTFEFCDAAVDEYLHGIKNNVLPKEYKKEGEGVCCPPRGWFKSMCSWLGGR